MIKALWIAYVLVLTSPVWGAPIIVAALRAHDRGTTVWVVWHEWWRSYVRWCDQFARVFAPAPRQRRRRVSQVELAEAFHRRAFLKGEISVDEFERRIQRELEREAA